MPSTRRSPRCRTRATPGFTLGQSLIASDEPIERALGARILGSVINPDRENVSGVIELLAPLIEPVHDSRVLASAIRALSHSRDRASAIATSRHAVHADADVRLAVAQALSLATSERSRPRAASRRSWPCRPTRMTTCATGHASASAGSSTSTRPSCARRSRLTSTIPTRTRAARRSSASRSGAIRARSPRSCVRSTRAVRASCSSRRPRGSAMRHSCPSSRLRVRRRGGGRA